MQIFSSQGSSIESKSTLYGNKILEAKLDKYFPRLVIPFKCNIRVLRKSKEGTNNKNFGNTSIANACMIFITPEHFGLQSFYQTISRKTTHGSISIQKRTLNFVMRLVFGKERCLFLIQFEFCSTFSSFAYKKDIAFKTTSVYILQYQHIMNNLNEFHRKCFQQEVLYTKHTFMWGY